MKVFLKKELRLQKKAEKKRAKAEEKRRKKIQNRLDWCLVGIYFLLSLVTIVMEIINHRKTDREDKK